MRTTNFLKLAMVFTISFFSLSGLSQLTVNNGFTAQQLGNNLAGNNVNVFNASISGDPQQYGTFNFTGTTLGLNSGVILSTGNIDDAVGPNNSGSTSSGMGGAGDPDLTALAGFQTFDEVVFEFDFEVLGDEIEFNFVFLSEEYNEFVNTGFNDVFAFYISGPGIVGQENIAVVPGTTTPVTINTINNGSFWQFYNDNTAGGTNIEFDGFTTLMTAFKDGLMQCGVYTLSLRIADGSDSAYDSAVLLQENSLVQSNISASSATFSGNNTALEGCIEASFTFALDSALTQDVNIQIGIGGSATNGVDYEQIDNLITIPAGQTSATIIIDAILDGITEGQEVIELYYTPEPCQPQDTVYLYIDDYTPLEYEVFPSDVTCTGLNDGLVDLTVSGGLAPYTLTLTDSITGNETSYTSFPVIGLAPGTYYVEVIDGYGCTAADVVAGNLFDAGQTFLPDGTGASYTSDLTISGFQAGQTITSVDQIVSICATMEHSYANDLTIELMAPNGQTIVLKNVGPTGGAINACNLGEPVASGPVDSWNNSNTTPGIGYQYCWDATPTYPTMNAMIQAGAPGPPPQYTYTTQVGNTYTDYYLPAGSYTPVQSFTGLIGAPLNGTWTIVVTDNYALDNGYIFDWSISLQADLPDSIFTIEEPVPPVFAHTTVAPDCGLNNGSVDLTVTGGDGPFTYLWNTGATTQDLSGVGAGVYTVDVTDVNACVHDYQVDVSNSGTLVVNGTSTSELCVDHDNGAVDLTVSGGTAPFNFVWSNGASSEDISGLAPGGYSVTVQDAGGCQGVSSYTINAATDINISAETTNENCGDGEGIINLTVYGTVNPVTYSWSNAETTEDINELTQGTYFVDITDGNGCFATDTFSIINLVGNCVPNCDLSITSSVVIDENCGNGLGAIDITTFTSNGPVSVTWSNGATTQDINGLSVGQYTVDLTDNEGCLATQIFDVLNQTGGLSITGINTTNEYCGNGQGGADITVTGGALPYSYLWSNASTNQDLTGVASGAYSVTVTDANGCEVNGNVTVTNDAGTLAQTYGNAVNEVCGNSNGSIDIVITGGLAPYSYLWTNGATTQDLIGISAGTYSCVITDAGGCSISTPTYTVTNQAGTLNFDNIDVDNEICTNANGSIELLYSGGTAPYSVLWNTGATTQDIFNLSAATFYATVTDASGCSLSTGDLFVINESGTLQLSNVDTYNETCGNSSGIVNITISGGTAPYTFAWSNGSNSEDLYNLSAGNYDCVITDVNGCTVYANASVANDPGVLSIDNIIVTDDNCSQGIGALNAIISGASNPVIYSWSNGATTQDQTGLFAGTYTLNITDNNGCATSGVATINNTTNGLNLVSEQVTNEVCGDGNGAIDLLVSGGTAPITYSWSSGQTTEDLNGLSSGTYTCTITDNTGCSVIAGTYTINNSSGTLNASIAASTNEICGNGLGSIDVNVAGGTAPYSYSWSSGQSSQDITGLSAGTYDLIVTDAAGCETTISATLTNESGTLAIDNFVVTNETCGNNLGAINITISGGTPAYSYSWSNSPTTQDISGLNSGTYSVIVNDANGCSVNSGPISITDNPGNYQLVDLVVSDEVCGDGTGAIDVILSGGVNPITYSWSNGATTQDLSNLSAGTYTGTSTDNNGCTLNWSATVMNDAGSLSVSDAITNASCSANNGSIDITVSGGSGYVFVWSNGSTSEDISGLLGGTYTCNITDGAGCTTTYVGTVADEGGPLITSVNITDESCGNSDGEISVNAVGGAAPLTYVWTGPPCCAYTINLDDTFGDGWNGGSIDVLIDGVPSDNITLVGGFTGSQNFSVCDGQSIELIWNAGTFDNEVSFEVLDASSSVVFTQGLNPTAGTVWTGTAVCSAPAGGNTLSNVPAGTYTVVVTDANGCEDNATIVVNNSTGTLQIANAVVSDETCLDANGSIDLTVTGGTAPIDILWSNAEVTEDISNLTTGSYSVDITDAVGCAITANYNIADISFGLDISMSSVSDENCGDGTGAIDITTTGGAGPLSYNWSNGSTAEDLSSLNAGSYTVTISDGSICQYEETFTVVNNAGTLFANPAVINETCGNANGSVQAFVTGGTQPYTYQWSNGGVIDLIDNLSSGTYNCTVTDAVGCALTFSVFVNNANGGLAATATVQDENCGDVDGAVNLNVTGGTSPYAYLWSNGATTQDLNNVSYGAYTVTVTDANGCSVTESYNVASDGNFNYNANITNENCVNGNGAIDLQFFGGPNPAVYTWSNGATTQDINGLSTGWYIVTMQSFGGPGVGCTMVDSFFVDVNMGSIAINSIVVANETCSLGDGAVDASISGGTAPYTYSWSNGGTTEDLSGLVAGAYSLTVTDAIGCSATMEAVVNSYTFGFGIAGVSITDEICGDGSGAIDASISGGSLPVTYSWSNGATSEDISGVGSGIYTLTATDASGCTVSNDFTVGNITNGFGIGSNVTDETCGNSNGAINLTTSGGVAPVSYNWSNGAFTEDISNLDGGIYTCIITDNLGCEITVVESVASLSETLSSGAAVTDENCGDANGSIILNPAGGTAPYTYTWDAIDPCCTYTLDMQDQGNSWNGASVDVFLDGAFEGQYTVPGGGANLETFTVCNGQTIELYWNSGMFDNEVSFDLLDADGATVFSQGGSPTVGLIYTGSGSCSAPYTGGNLTGLSAGIYPVTITDAIGCSFVDTFYVLNNTGGFAVAASVSIDDYCQSNSGAIDITVTGGTAPFIFDWSDGSTTEDISGLAAGNYYVNIEDATGCSFVDTFEVMTNTGSFAVSNSVVTDELCLDGTGSIDLTVGGGTAPYTYSWSNSAVSEDISALSAGSYDVTITDDTGCELYATYVVSNNTNGFDLASSTVTDENCGADDGSIDITITGGVMPYDYTWSNSATSEDISGLAEGTYDVTIADANGCEVHSSYTIINVTGNFVLTTYNVTDENCGDADGAIDISVAGGVLPYTYSWSNAATSEDISGLTAGTYDVNVTDDSGCELVQSFTVGTAGTPVNVLNSAITDATCATCLDGAINMTMDPAGAPYLFSWSNGSTNEDVSNLNPGTYTVTITNNEGCQTVLMFTVKDMAGITENDKVVLLISPNPTFGSFDLKYENLYGPDMKVKFYDAAGRLVLEHSHKIDANNGSINFDLTHFTPGAYLISIESETFKTTERLIIQ